MTTSDDQRHAQMLYGESTPAPAPAPAQQPMSDHELAEKLFDGPKPQVDYLSGEPLPPPETPLTRDIVTAGIERFGLEPAEAQKSAHTWQATLNSYDVRGAEAEHLVALGIAAMDGHEVDELSLRNDARREMQIAYGQAADQVLDDARRLVARDRELYNFLSETNLGSHRAVVLAIARRARALRQAGKL